MIISMKRKILIPILLSTFLLVGYGETPKEKNNLSNNFKKSDWQQCPQPLDPEELTWEMIDTLEINSKKELINFISTAVHVFEPSPIRLIRISVGTFSQMTLVFFNNNSREY